MGTSSSSTGPGSNVSFDPPWLNDIPIGGGGEQGDEKSENEPPNVTDPAPKARFRSARRNLGVFARTGDTSFLGRAAGYYSRTGMGGAKNVASRMKTSTRAAAGLGSFLQTAREKLDPQVNKWMDELRATNPSVQTVIDAIVTQIIPEGGSRDEESAKDSMAQALSDLMILSPNIDLLELHDSQIWTLIQIFIGHEACNRMYADIGQLFENAKYSPAEMVQRTHEMREFLKNSVSAQLEQMRQSYPNPTHQQLETLLNEAVQMIFTVFEGEI